MTMKNRKTLAAVAVLLALALVFVAPVSAGDTETGVSCEGTSCTHVAAVTIDGTVTHYTTLAAAIDAAETASSSEKQIEVDLLVDVNGDSEASQGISIASYSNILIDFNNHYYNGTTPLAGSEGTKSQVFQLLKDSTIVMKNGTIKSKDAAMLVQNYANLTLENMTLDGTALAQAFYVTSQTEGPNYVLSNNVGTVVIKDTTIKAESGDFAFDVYGTYTGSSNKLSVTVEGKSDIVGLIEFVAKDGRDVSLTINGGTFTDPTVLNYLGSEATTETVTVKLAETVTLEKCVEVNGNATLDLNGQSIGFDNESWIMNTCGDALFAVKRGGHLVITDSSESKAGVIDGSTDSSDVYAAVKMTVYGEDNSESAAKLTVNGGTLKGYYYGIVGNGGRDNTEIVINGGTITSTDGCGIYHPQSGSLTVTGGTIEGATAIYFKSGSLSISSITGGIIKGTGAKADYSYVASGFNPTGDALVIENVDAAGYDGIGTVSITGGTFTSTNAGAVASYAATSENSHVTTVTAFITGGTFSSDVSDYVAAGHTCTANADESTWTVGQKPLTIIYDDGLENGKTMTQTIEDDAETVDLTEDVFTCEGATFLGWNATSVDGTDVDYAYAETGISVSALNFGEDRELTLYAVWASVVTEEIEIEATVNEATGNTTATFTDAEVISEIDPKLQFKNTTWIEYGDAIIGIIFTNAADNETFAFNPTSLDAPIMGALALTGGLSSNTDNVYYSEYYVWLGMKNLTSIPEIDGTFNETIAALPDLAELDEVITMISAEADNTNLTEVSVVFVVSKADGDVMENFVGYHVHDNTVTQLTDENFEIEEDTETNSWIITLTGTGFSSYVVGYETPASTGGDSGSGSGSGSGSSSGNGSSNGSSSSGSTSGATTGTPDVPPTEEPTDVPGTDLPEIPDVQDEPETPATPAPILAVLAGLGAAVVLRRK